MGMFDWFAGRLECYECGRISPEDESTEMQTKINVIPTLRCLRVGNEVDFQHDKLRVVFDVVIRDAGPDESTHILRMWHCPYCGTGDNWVEIVINPQGVIESMKAVEFNLNTFDRAHGIEPGAIESVYPLYTNKMLDSISTPLEEWVPPLRRALMEAKARESQGSGSPASSK